MREETARDPAATEFADRTPVYVLGLGKLVGLRGAAYGVVLLFLAAGVFSALAGAVGSPRLTLSDSVTPVFYIVAYGGTLVAHELVHGLFFTLFGGRPRYGAGVSHFVPYFYATSSGEFSPRQMTIICLAPLVLLSGLSVGLAWLVPALAGYMAVAFVGNVSGAVGDFWMASRLARFFPFEDAVVLDSQEQMAVYSEDAGAAAVAAKLSARDERSPGFVSLWALASFGVLVLGIFVGALASFFTESLLIGPHQFPLVAFGGEPRRVTFSLAVPVAAGLAFALIWRGAHLGPRIHP